MNEKSYSLKFLSWSINAVESNGKVRLVHLSRSPPKRRSDKGKLGECLRKYAAGERIDFKDLELDFSGYTDFEKKVLKTTRKIPYGQIKTYGEIAKAIGNPKAMRAVGQAVGKNRFGIVIPCHRVVAHNGLGGFGGGLKCKRALLNHEGSLKKALTISLRSSSKSSKRQQ